MSIKVAQILANPIVAKLHEPTPELRLMVAEMLSFKVDTGPNGNSRSWDGYTSLFNRTSNTFPAGFIRLVQKKLEMAGYRVNLARKEAPLPLGPENPTVDDFPEDPRYDYQMEVVRRLEKLKGTIAQVATGGGKSRIFKLCTKRLGMPTLFVTTRKSLMYQMAKDYQACFREHVGILGDGQWNPVPNGVNFAIVDTLTSRLENLTIEKEVEKMVERHIVKVEKVCEGYLKGANLPFEGSVKSLPDPIRRKVMAVRDQIHANNPIDRVRMAEQVKIKVLAQQERRAETIALLSGIGFLCLEEAHEVSGNGYYDIANACKNAHYRLALTATPFMKDDEEANMRLMAATGPVGIRVSEKLLIDRGILATPHFMYIEPPAPAVLRRTTAWQAAYRIGVVENSARNKAIVDECVTASQYGLTSMVLVQHKVHGEALLKGMESQGLRVSFIYGDHNQTEREQALKSLGSGKLDVLIGSTILDVGVDVPSVGLIVLAGAGKAEVSLRQRVGRGLRAKKSGPNKAFIVDFNDRGNNHLIGHSMERRRIVEDTPGFAERIIKGRSFDYEAHGFTRQRKVS